MPARPPATTRRTAVALGVAGLVSLAACDGDDSPSPAPRASTSGDPDQALVERVLSDLEAASRLAGAVAAAFPRLARPMRSLRRVHDAHIAALGGERPTGHGAAHGDAAAALGRVRRREQRLQRRLVDASVSAESGRLARLLASMSAATSQQLVALPQDEA